MPRLTLPLLLLLTLAAPAAGDELKVVGEHEWRGTLGGAPFTGTLRIAPDATFRGERDRGGPLEGRVRIVKKALVLAPAGGAERVFERADNDDSIRWRWAHGEDAELLIEPGRKENTVGLVGRVLRRRGVMNFLLGANLGQIDPNPDALILRSKLPKPNDLMKWKEEYGLKTVLSLNGDNDDDAWYWPPGDSTRKAQKVNLAGFIKQRFEHYTFGLSASRAPSRKELAGIFKILLDDSKKPIVVHCRGGADRTGVIGALYQMEFLGKAKPEAKQTMRKHLWVASDGTEIQGAVVDLYQLGALRKVLAEEGVEIPARYATRPRPAEPAEPKRWFNLGR